MGTRRLITTEKRKGYKMVTNSYKTVTDCEIFNNCAK